MNTKQPIIPVGWFPKPKQDAYNYLDWLVNYQQWQAYVKAQVAIINNNYDKN